MPKVGAVPPSNGDDREGKRTYLDSERAVAAEIKLITTETKLTVSDQKLVASELALATARSEIRDGMKASVDLPREVERLKTELQQVCLSLDRL